MKDINEVADLIERMRVAREFNARAERAEHRFTDILFALYGLQLEISYSEPTENERAITITWWDDDEDMNKLLVT